MNKTVEFQSLMPDDCGAVVSEEELAYLEQCLRKPAGPSPTILKGAALLQQLKQPIQQPVGTRAARRSE
jgi:hypothetical protein